MERIRSAQDAEIAGVTFRSAQDAEIKSVDVDVDIERSHIHNPAGNLNLFFEYWKRRDWHNMAVFACMGWKSNKPDMNHAIKNLFHEFDLRHWKILETRCITETHCVVKAELKYKFAGQKYVKQVSAVMYCEVMPYREATNGYFGVDPVRLKLSLQA